MKYSLVGIFFLSLLTLVNCNGTEEKKAENTAAPAAAAPADNKGPTVEIKLESKGETMEYIQKTLEVKAGSTVKLTFKNNAVQSKLEHNVVVAKPGSDAELATAGIAAGYEKGWIPVGNPNIIASSKLVKGGESETITFTAPAAGDYPYLCTAPGHSSMMKGVLKVKP